MEDTIKARIAELKQAEKKTEIDLIAIRTVIGELEQILNPKEDE